MIQNEMTLLANIKEHTFTTLNDLFLWTLLPIYLWNYKELMSNIRSKSAHFLAPRIKNNRDQTESKHTTYEGSENMLKWK